MISEPQRKALRHFFAAYFHQDWRAEAETPEQVVAMYAADMRDLEAFDAVIDGIPGLIAAYPNEDELAEVLFRTFGCFYSSKSLGQSTHAWLLHIAETLKAERPGVAQRDADRRAQEALDDAEENYDA